MQVDQVWEDYASLPAEAQREAADFIAFLRMRYAEPKAGKRKSHTDLSNEPFVGMWRDRDDMQDSTQWVRDLRQREWTR
jgi:hypothetical protein